MRCIAIIRIIAWHQRLPMFWIEDETRRTILDTMRGRSSHHAEFRPSTNCMMDFGMRITKRRREMESMSMVLGSIRITIQNTAILEKANQSTVGRITVLTKRGTTALIIRSKVDLARCWIGCEARVVCIDGGHERMTGHEEMVNWIRHEKWAG